MSTDNKLPIVVVLERLIEDESFRDDFFTNAEAALENEDLTGEQKKLLYNLKEDDIRHLDGENIEELFLAESAVYMPNSEDADGPPLDYLSDDLDLNDLD